MLKLSRTLTGGVEPDWCALPPKAGRRTAANGRSWASIPEDDSRHTPVSCSARLWTLGGRVIEDEVLVGLVPPLMQKAQEGPEAWDWARSQLVAEFEERLSRSEAYRCCVIAHYVAVLSVDVEDRLAWNTRALAQSENADPAQVRSFLPSLKASIGACYFDQGELPAARRWYEGAEGHVGDLPATPYGDKIRTGIKNRLEALREVGQ